MYGACGGSGGNEIAAYNSNQCKDDSPSEHGEDALLGSHSTCSKVDIFLPRDTMPILVNRSYGSMQLVWPPGLVRISFKHEKMPC